MKLFLLIFFLVCISITTAQRCTRKNETYTHIAKPLKAKTVKRCIAKCETSPNCVSWTWNKKKKKCYLIREFDLAERAPWISGNCGDYVLCGNGDFKPQCSRCGTTDEDCQGLNMKSDCVLDDVLCLSRDPVLCGDGNFKNDCSFCPKTQDGCQGSNPKSDCKFDDFIDECVPRNRPKCGDGSTKTSCDDCGTEARQCQGYDPNSECFIDDTTGTCIPRKSSFTEEESCLDCIKNDCLPCLSICSDGISAKCLECIGFHCALTCGLICS